MTTSKKKQRVKYKGCDFEIGRSLERGRVEVVSQKSNESTAFHLKEVEEIVSDDEPIQISPHAQINSEEAEEAHKRFLVLRDYRAGYVTKSEAMALLDIRKTAFYKWLKRFDDEIGVPSVIGFKRGRKLHSRRLPSRVEDVISSCIKRYYVGRSATIKRVHDYVVIECGKILENPPGISTVRARIKELTPFESLKARNGSRAAIDKLGAKPGRLVVDRPLAFVEMDHTLVDVTLVDEKTRKVFGRPWLTIIIDVYSRVILGYYLSLDAPSARSIAAALTLACIPKKEYLNFVGSTVRYPFYGKPHALQMDNAAEFTSAKFISACARNGIKHILRPIGKKHYGGHVERLIGTLMGKVHFLPGTTFSNPVKKGDYDSLGNAAMSLPEFNKWFLIQMELYHDTKHSALKNSPANVWNGYYESHAGESSMDTVKDPKSFRLDFMPEVLRNISRKGIEFAGNFYFSDGLALHVGRKKVIVKYDPYSMKTIWAMVGGVYIAADYGSNKKDMTFEENKIENLRSQYKPWLTSDERKFLIEGGDDIIDVGKKLTRTARKAAKVDSYKSVNDGIARLTNNKSLDDQVLSTKDSSLANFVPTPFKHEE